MQRCRMSVRPSWTQVAVRALPETVLQQQQQLWERSTALPSVKSRCSAAGKQTFDHTRGMLKRVWAVHVYPAGCLLCMIVHAYSQFVCVCVCVGGGGGGGGRLGRLATTITVAFSGSRR